MNIQNFQENINYVPAESEAPLSQTDSSENSENFELEIEEENNGPFYHQETKTESMAKYMYKICDDSVKSRQFLSTDSKDGIEAILSKQQEYSLHEFIDGNDPLHSI